MDPSFSTIERAFQLARESTSLDEVKAKLRGEGYSNVDAHLTGKQIKSDLTKVLKKRTSGSL